MSDDKKLEDNLFSTENIKEAYRRINPLAIQYLALEPEGDDKLTALTQEGKNTIRQALDRLTKMGYSSVDARQIFRDVVWEICDQRSRDGLGYS